MVLKPYGIFESPGELNISQCPGRIPGPDTTSGVNMGIRMFSDSLGVSKVYPGLGWKGFLGLTLEELGPLQEVGHTCWSGRRGEFLGAQTFEWKHAAIILSWELPANVYIFLWSRGSQSVSLGLLGLLGTLFSESRVAKLFIVILKYYLPVLLCWHW